MVVVWEVADCSSSPPLIPSLYQTTRLCHVAQVLATLFGGLPTSVLLFIHGVFLPFSLVSDASVSLAYVVFPFVRWDLLPA